MATWNDHDAAIKKALFDAECLAFTQSVSDTTQLTSKQRRVYDRAFVLIDDDGSGAIGPEELVLIMSHLGKPMSLRRATAIIAASDSAGGRLVSTGSPFAVVAVGDRAHPTETRVAGAASGATAGSTDAGAAGAGVAGGTVEGPQGPCPAAAGA